MFRTHRSLCSDIYDWFSIYQKLCFLLPGQIIVQSWLAISISRRTYLYRQSHIVIGLVSIQKFLQAQLIAWCNLHDRSGPFRFRVSIVGWWTYDWSQLLRDVQQELLEGPKTLKLSLSLHSLEQLEFSECACSILTVHFSDRHQPFYGRDPKLKARNILV